MRNIDRSRVLNTTNTNLPEYVLNTLANDPKHAITLDKVQPTKKIITEIEDNIKKLMSYNNKLKVTSQSNNAKITDLEKTKKFLSENKQLTIVKADKGKKLSSCKQSYAN
ncbi:hypothetical protein HHI36_008799, partial [Cryptolaemus montrouzieri]